MSKIDDASNSVSYTDSQSTTTANNTAQHESKQQTGDVVNNADIDEELVLDISYYLNSQNQSASNARNDQLNSLTIGKEEALGKLQGMFSQAALDETTLIIQETQEELIDNLKRDQKRDVAIKTATKKEEDRQLDLRKSSVMNPDRDSREFQTAESERNLKEA
ncbi:MAG: hypothetical protein HUJ26_05380 [Planctomycetaceae bacterium]|nr:hypothetical protein [Planctomycetaceae bacterium]